MNDRPDTPADTAVPRVALVTGARGGIGREVTARLRALGCRVAAAGRDADALASVDADAHVAADVTTPEGAAAAVAACRERLGAAPALLAHCVGSTLIAPLHRTGAEQYREVMRVNLDSAFYVLHAWVEALRAAGTPGRGGAGGERGVAHRRRQPRGDRRGQGRRRGAGAQRRGDLRAAQGIRVNAVAPGMTDTPMTAAMLRLDAMREGAGRQYPLGGVQSAGQVADAIAWLLTSEGASRITGQVIAVDGGFTTVRPLVKSAPGRRMRRRAAPAAWRPAAAPNRRSRPPPRRTPPPRTPRACRPRRAPAAGRRSRCAARRPRGAQVARVGGDEHQLGRARCRAARRCGGRSRGRACRGGRARRRDHAVPRQPSALGHVDQQGDVAVRTAS